jgi:hypothetical protein
LMIPAPWIPGKADTLAISAASNVRLCPLS